MVSPRSATFLLLVIFFIFISNDRHHAGSRLVSA